MTDSRTEKLGLILKQARNKQQLTQEQLAAMSGVGVRFVRELEQGKKSCYLSKSLDVISMLGLDITIGNHKL